MAKKKRQKIEGQFVPLQHLLLDSLAFKSLRDSSKIGLIYFRKDIKSNHQISVILTFPQAKEYGVCQSPSTFNVIKRELVEKGFLDPFEPGGLGKHSTFKISFRWKLFGTSEFENVPFKPGNGSKYFKTIWKNDQKKKNLLEARHGTKKQDTGYV